MSRHVCPWWLGYLLASPLRRLIQDPAKILRPYVTPAMTALDVGSGMGFFTLPLAERTGPSGRVVAVDLQEKMLQGLMRRAQRAGLADRIETRLCTSDSLGLKDLEGSVDFALAFALLHEVPDRQKLLTEISRSMKPEGTFLLAEPAGHVTRADFEITVAYAEAAGFRRALSPSIRRSHSVVMKKG